LGDFSVQLQDIGARLRQERERLGLNQTDLGAVAEVTRNTQAEYEGGKRAFNVNYMLAIRELGIDPIYLLEGVRPIGAMTDDEASFMSCLDVLSSDEQRALLTIAHSMAGRPLPAASHSLPSTTSLTEAFGALLDASPGLAGDDLAHELATRLPIILRAAEREIASPRSDSSDVLGGQRADPADARRAGRPGRNT
jgi:transcriptional regulator with XRE-family HTH domain